MVEKYSQEMEHLILLNTPKGTGRKKRYMSILSKLQIYLSIWRLTLKFLQSLVEISNKLENLSPKTFLHI